MISVNVIFAATVIVGRFGFAVNDLVEEASTGWFVDAPTDLIANDIVNTGVEDWLNYLPLKAPLTQGVYTLKGEAFITVDDVKYVKATLLDLRCVNDP